MKPFEFFLLIGAIYSAPRVSNRCAEVLQLLATAAALGFTAWDYFKF